LYGGVGGEGLGTVFLYTACCMQSCSHAFLVKTIVSGNPCHAPCTLGHALRTLQYHEMIIFWKSLKIKSVRYPVPGTRYLYMGAHGFKFFNCLVEEKQKNILLASMKTLLF
jgi:hypothetical protein